jgi:hypothetical protein
MIFEGCRQRIDRANFHNQTAAKIWNEGIPSHAQTPIVNVNRDGTGTIHVHTLDSRVMGEMSIELGEVFYQLRAALDACIYECAILESGKNPPPDEGSLQFPICPTPKHFKSSAKYIAPLPQVLRELVEFVQPYNAPEIADHLKVENINRTLWILNEWARIDRHRRLHTIGVLPAAVNPEFRLPPGTSLAWINVAAGGNILQNEAQVASFKIAGWREGMNVQVNPNLAFDIALDEAPALCASNDILGERIRFMLVNVKAVISIFEKHYS